MSIEYLCPGCGKKFYVSPQLVHELTQCPDCGTRWSLDTADGAAASQRPPRYQPPAPQILPPRPPPPSGPLSLPRLPGLPEQPLSPWSSLPVTPQPSLAPPPPLDTPSEPAWTPPEMPRPKHSPSPASKEGKRSSRPRRFRLPVENNAGLVIAVIVLLLILGAGTWYFFLRGGKSSADREHGHKDNNGPVKDGGENPPPAVTEAASALIPFLSDDGEKGQKAREDLKRLGMTALPDLREKGIRHVHPLIRRESLKLITELGPDADAAFSELTTVLVDVDARVRRAAIDAVARVGKLRRPDVLVALVPLADDADREIAAGVRKELGQVGLPAKADAPQMGRLLGRVLQRDRLRFVVGLTKLDLDASTVVALLVALVREPDDDIRKAIYEALGHVGSSARGEALPLLLDGLGELNKDVAKAAAEALNRGDLSIEHLPRLVDLLTGSERTQAVQLFVLSSLRRMPGLERKTVLAPLMKVIRSDSKELRQAGIETLQALGPPDASEWAGLVKSVREPGDPVEWRLYAVQQLAAQPARALDSGPVLVAALRDSETVVRRAAAAALRKLKPRDSETVAALTRVLDGNDAEMKLFAVQTLVELHTVRGAYAGLLRALQDDDPEMVRLVGEKLYQIPRPPEDSLNSLTLGLKSSKRHVRMYCVTALAQLGEAASPAVAALTDAVKDKDLELAYRAARTLKAIGPRAAAAAPALVEALAHKQPAVKVHAAATLIALGQEPAKAVEVLIQALKDPDDPAKVRPVALEALQAIKPDMPDVAKVLAPALADSELREHVAPILQKLGKNAVPEVVRLIRSPDDDTRIWVCKVIKSIGRPAFDANAFLPLAEQFMRETNADVRQAIKDTLEAIQKK